MASQIWRHGRFNDVTPETAGRREPAAQEDVPRGEAQGRDRVGGSRKKVVRPSRRKEMAVKAVRERGICIRVAYQVFRISESCYRYERKLDAENEEVAT